MSKQMPENGGGAPQQKRLGDRHEGPSGAMQSATNERVFFAGRTI